MAIRRVSLLTLAALLVFVCKSSNADGVCSSLTAAYNKEDNLFLFYGNRYVLFDQTKKRRRSSGPVRKLFKNMPDVHIDAAYRPSGQGKTVFLISGDVFYTVYKNKVKKGALSLSSRFPNHKAFAKGIDASATHRTSKKTYFFKGCTVIRRDSRRRRHVSFIKKMGLPCNVDAAWYERGIDRIVVNKGAFTWSVDTKKKKSYPYCFFCLNR